MDQGASTLLILEQGFSNGTANFVVIQKKAIANFPDLSTLKGREVLVSGTFIGERHGVHSCRRRAA